MTFSIALKKPENLKTKSLVRSMDNLKIIFVICSN